MTDERSKTFVDFEAYWRLGEEMIENANKDQLAYALRILAMQSAHRTPAPRSYSKGTPQPSQSGPSMKWMRLQAAGSSPTDRVAAPPSSDWGGKSRSSALRTAAFVRAPGFHQAPASPSG